ncbi:Protein of unknown function DUF3511 [Dillenia turbinata]|uniref:Uncharacterized protein n=1 Tax=Dillenia turbinata TaxID=194707 RepID=A0AAN8W499_9MAGN
MSEFSKSYGRDRRTEIVVSGRTSSSSSVAKQIYMTRPRSPDLPPIPPPRMNQRTSHETTSSLPWSFNDPEMKRKKRVAKYKVYAVEGRFKASLRRGLRWFKNKCSQIVDFDSLVWDYSDEFWLLGFNLDKWEVNGCLLNGFGSIGLIARRLGPPNLIPFP